MKTYYQFTESIEDYINRGKNKRIPGEDKASFGKLFKDELKQMGKFRNPKTKKEAVISERNVIIFKPSKYLKDKINNVS